MLISQEMKLLTVFLVIAILLIGLPLSMGMEQMAYCPDCLTPNPSAWSGVCLAVIAAGLLIAGLALVGRAWSHPAGPRPLRIAASLDKPPRFA